jgi:Ca-activated chloride channel family protein
VTVAGWALLLLLAGTDPAATTDHAPLAERHQQFLEETDLLLTEEEIAAFLALGRDYQRDAFIERFWRQRDPNPDTGVNEMRREWRRRLDLVDNDFEGLDDPRSRHLLTHGIPTTRLPIYCRRQEPQIDVWIYAGGTELFGQPYALIFYRKWDQAFRLVYPGEGTGGLYEACPLQDLKLEEQDVLTTALKLVLGIYPRHYMETLAPAYERPDRGSEWVDTFESYSTDVPEDASPLPARLDVSFPGRQGSRTVVRATVTVPRELAGREQLEGLPGHGSHHLSVNGEILDDEGRLFESFRYRFDFPGLAPGDATAAGDLPLVAERRLRPGDYTLILRVLDLPSGDVFRAEEPLTVPEVDRVLPAAPPDDAVSRAFADYRALLDEQAAAAGATGDGDAANPLDEATLRLIPPRGELLTGMVRFETLTTGTDRFDRVVFAVDGEPVLTKGRPPYGVELDLGDLPRNRRITATAYDAAGEELAFDGIDLNSGSNRFALTLLEPRPGAPLGGDLPLRAQLDVPDGREIERLEVWLDETRRATLYDPPWRQSLPLAPGEAPVYLRAVAVLDDGHSTESVVLLGPAGAGGASFGDSVDVRMVELYATVTDRQGRPIGGLDQGDFEVEEDGTPQRILRFERVADRPIHAAILLDVSASMEDRLDGARQAALGFFRDVVDPDDRAALVTFNDRPQLAVPFTAELPKLGTGLAALQAERGTSLWDSVIYGLYVFNGVAGQKALLVLSDGEDESSRFTSDEALELAQRAGVTVYAIGLDLPRGQGRRQLGRLAEVTGGRSFLIDGVGELPAVYRQIEEDLRSQYFLSYQSSAGSGGAGRDGFRRVEVEVGEPRGAEVRTSSGYYP